MIRNIRKGFMFLRREGGITPEDQELLGRHLSDDEKALFGRMDEPDQVHSVRVARLCAQSLEHHPQVDRRSMMRAALLHDVGKIGAGLSLGFRTFWILFHRVLPGPLDWIAGRSASARMGSLRWKMYVQMDHAAIGVEMLRPLGVEEDVLRLITYTGGRSQPDDPIDKRILMRADSDVVVGADRE